MLRAFDHNGAFRAIAENEELARLTVRNAGITVFAQAAVFFIQLLGALILVRTLTPADFGLVTMITTFSLLPGSFGLAGFTEALIQAEHITHSLTTNIFWLCIGGGLVLSVGFGFAGPLIARFYGQPELIPIAIAFSFVIFLSIVPAIHLSLLKRAMRFGAVAINDIAGRIAYLLTAVVAARMGWGYWALVAGTIAQPLVIGIGAILLCPWVPGLPRRVEGTCRIIQYAASVYGRWTMNYFNGNTDNLLVGWRFGAYSLGVYKKAFDLFVLPTAQLLSPTLAVVVNTLSRKRNDIEDYKRHLLKGLSLVAFVGMAIGACFTLIGNDIVRLLLGPKWVESQRIFRYFAPGIGLMLLYQTSSWIHLSLGTMRRWLYWTIIEFVTMTVLFVLGLHWGPVGVAAGWTASFCILTVPAYWYAGRPIGLSATSVIAAIWRYLAASATAGFATFALEATPMWTPFASTLGLPGIVERIIATSGIFTFLYFGVIVVLSGSWEPLRSFARLAPDLLPGSSIWRRFRLSKIPTVL